MIFVKFKLILTLFVILCVLFVSVSTGSTDISNVENNDTIFINENEFDLAEPIATPTANVTAEPIATPTANVTAEPTATPPLTTFVTISEKETSCVVPFRLKFSGTSIGSNADLWQWMLNDTVLGTEINYTHTFTVPGKYTVILNATNISNSIIYSASFTVIAEENKTYSRIDNESIPETSETIYSDTGSISYMGEIFNVSTSAGNFSKLAFDGENVTLLITGLEEGACANVTVDIPFEMPNGIYIYYWKEIPGRQIIPVTYDVSDDNRHLTFQLQDGVVDEDGLTNGEIYDPLSLAPPRFLVTSTISGGEGTLSVTETATGDHYDIGLETSEGIFTSLYLVDAENLPGAGNFVFPYQLVKFTIEDITPSGSTDATITYPDVSSLKDDFSLSYHKFNPNTLAWQNFPAQFSGNTVTLSLTDGGAGDDDAVANGIIADPGGLILEDPADSGGGATPTVAFNGTPTSGFTPLTVAFTDESTYNPTGWAWFFGDETWTQAWTRQTENAGWLARISHTSVAMPDGSIVLVGLFDNGNDVWRSLDKGATWTQQTASAGWSERRRAPSVSMPDGSIVLMGGVEFDGITTNYKNDVWRSVDNGVTWTLQNASAEWYPRHFIPACQCLMAASC